MVEDVFINLSDNEKRIYDAVEDYISTTYNEASAKEENAVGFVMTIYRRRLASSFAALANTLADRGSWRTISRDDAKRRFREGQADILLCTDAAAEGLNFQFCGALINYDMPWNPMRVEQRIGRIDRLGQKHEKIRIVNLHYSGRVEADVYSALRGRIQLFEAVVGRLQPILAKLPSLMTRTNERKT